jgi:hypothetical protein
LYPMVAKPTQHSTAQRSVAFIGVFAPVLADLGYLGMVRPPSTKGRK